ncbi:SGNH/GDSL hydrolase family protein [Muriicola sp. Z0-33]|uniref:SGNH/GDSL hydrolase family protein n=1 Tax=Muriicola sp. Z0-33 TaxID=2816957 RepID=UPI002238CE30|nr:SGNH/GDSL hydrolase family protein [Muriicola sp. Z0-33]MCW5516374.1 SGNH/GDSL hydrolase family protein [Muriicola sp. Z0-33]
MTRVFLLLFLLQGSFLFSQKTALLKWWNPEASEFNVIEGRAWPAEVLSPYDRLPARAQKKVREAVWNLSRHPTGLKIRFRSNAEEIVVRYSVKGEYSMNHMPATGVSGVDLYAKNSDGQWLWANARRSFADTVTYRFNGLRGNDRYHALGREYRLNLPLFNAVSWLEIGVAKDSYFEPLPVRKEKPIVVYGTSIAHGACASRPGMAWTNILSRELDRPLINLAFSGNGRLEKELIDLMPEIDAKLYILDCLPNLWREEQYDDLELENKILNAVRQLKKSNLNVPILLTEHAGYTDGFIRPGRLQLYTRVNAIQKSAFKKLLNEGISELYYLSYEELGLQLDDMVDGTHPNDLGMMRYAKAYEKKLRTILKEPKGKASTMQPVSQYREPENYDWENRHREIVEMNAAIPPKTVFFANSIIHFWGGLPRTKIAREETSWEEIFTPLGVRNFAYGWDRIENVLWRVYHGELDGFTAERIIVMIGTNNLHLNTDKEIINGLELLLKAIRARQPNAELNLLGLLPRRNQEDRVANLNIRIAYLAQELDLVYADLGTKFLDKNDTINESLFSDGLHPNQAGYLVLREDLLQLLNK